LVQFVISCQERKVLRGPDAGSCIALVEYQTLYGGIP
jgi:hypothetical protein